MTPTNRRITITGGAGFIGTHLAERLCADNDIVLFDNFRRDSLSALSDLVDHPRVTVVSGDVLEGEQVRVAIEGSDTIVHMAAIAGVSSYYREPLKTLQVNILGTVNVLEQAARAGVGTFVHFSTSEVFGSDALWVDETAPYQIGPVTDKRWTYATSKLAGEQFALRYGEQHGMSCSVLRPFNIYGPRQTGEGAISNFCTAVVERTPITVYGDGSPLRAWCFVSDMIDAVVGVISTPEAAGQAFNIGNPREVETTLGLARRIARIGGSVPIEYREIDRAEVRARIPNIDFARRLLRFEPQITLDEGLQSTLAWYRERAPA